MRSIERGTAAIARPHSTPLEGASSHSTPHSTSFNPTRHFIKNHESGFFIQAGHSTAMRGAFDSAWALLKNERITVKPYPLTPEEERFREREERAYANAREDYPQTSNVSNEDYEDTIEGIAEDNLAENMAENDYPWSKNYASQTTFKNDGSINRDPKVSRQRKLNARLNRESMRREAVPSRIEISPRTVGSRGNYFSLLNNEGDVLSQIAGDSGGNSQIRDFYGSTLEPYRRQGMYRKLMQALIGAGIPVKSNERNSQSGSFHRKFLESLPPNIESSYVDEYGNPKTSEPYFDSSDGWQNEKYRDNTMEHLTHNTPLEYYQKKVPQFLDAQGERSGLNRQDYGAIPIVNQANQARSMDEMAEQDRAKIRRGQGHEPERQGVNPETFTLIEQPMARNTHQIRFNPNQDTENQFSPLYSGSYGYKIWNELNETQ